MSDFATDAVRRLGEFTRSGGHHFWSDSPSLLDGGRFDAGQLSSHRRITDVYLLGLAVEKGGSLATFDRGIRSAAVSGAGEQHLSVLGTD